MLFFIYIKKTACQKNINPKNYEEEQYMRRTDSAKQNYTNRQKKKYTVRKNRAKGPHVNYQKKKVYGKKKQSKRHVNYQKKRESESICYFPTPPPFIFF